MAISQPSPVSDARATPKIEAAMRQIDRLITLVSAPLTVTSQRPVPAELHNWDLVAPTMLYSATSCLVSLRWLAEAKTSGRDEDALVLLRRLYEHAVLFAWIAIDPAVNAPRWVADDYYHRIQADKDLSLIGVEGLKPQQRAEFQAFIDQHRRRPNTADCADHADRYWTTRINGHGTFPRAVGEAQTGRYSLRKMYAAVYRPASANAHPTALSLRDFVWPTGTPDRYSIGFNPAHPIDPSPYTMAPPVFACMLLVAEQVLGRPCGDDVRAAFSE